MKRILITRPMPKSVISAAHKFFDVEVRQKQSPMSAAEMRASLALYDAVIPTLGDLYAARTFKDFSNPRCKILANFGVGYNHIDIAAAQAAGICVSNTPGAVTAATADIALMLILMSCRRAGEGERMVRASHWEGWNPTQMLGQHVTGKTVGIIGMGRIGEAVARRARGFGLSVHYHNRKPVHPETEAELEATYWESLEQMLARVDIVSVNCPHTSATNHLLSRERLSLMQRSAYLVNTSRGEVVDEIALADLLAQRHIAGAGLDVYSSEPEIPAGLRDLPNVVLLPHIGSATIEGRLQMGDKVIINVQTFWDGHTPPDRMIEAML